MDSTLPGSIHVETLRGWRRFLAFSGPAYLVSVGYMDPGNWAADLEAGSRFGYQLLWVLVACNLIALLLQTLSARLGIASGRDLAQCCREQYPRPVAVALWALCEISIAACDLAEVLGTAIGLKLLFGLPLLAGVLITTLSTLGILTLSRSGIKMLERIVLGLVALVGACVAAELVMARPDWAEVALGLKPSVAPEMLLAAASLLGATVMPHNLYLHSSLVQTRAIDNSPGSRHRAAWYNLLDSVLALNGAFLVNAGLLILAGAVFFTNHIAVDRIEQAHQLLSPLMGAGVASAVFAIALIASGQSSTVTGTLAGQIVMEGFLQIRMRPWLRSLLTRLAAVIPAVVIILVMGEGASYRLLLLSQVILSLQLPFAVIPLIHFTSDAERMREMKNNLLMRIGAWAAALLIVSLNLWLVIKLVPAEWAVLVGVPLLALLAYVGLAPRRQPVAPLLPEAPVALPFAAPLYRRILVPLDHSTLDRAALTHATAMAKLYGAKLLLLHVEEGVASQLYGDQAQTAEEAEGVEYLRHIELSLRQQSVDVEFFTAYSTDPKAEIIRFAREHAPDLVVMGSHGHRGIKDIIFGSTINQVRHELKVPVLAVRGE
ncbi:MAG: Nramp family divalent metal transporter [Acidobacteria bacterium]|nr:Nramp family divalent metal transporter [Acidobacteriota bacterium]